MGTSKGLKLASNFHRICKIKYKKYYILKADVSKFFASIDHDILKEKLKRKINDAEALKIVFDIIDSEENGLGIGAMTSQVLAIFYLNDLDHYIKEVLKIKYYVRYQDDFLLFHHSKEYLKYLDIVCVGTISDIVPLVDENRVITKLGLKLVPISKNIGLRTLLASTGYKEVNSTTISFGIAPRINACGRMGEEKEALRLFLTNDLHEAKEITERLNNYNLERQETEKRIFKQALEQIENGEKDKSCIVLGQEGWHHGIIGIVASKVTDIYFKPSILICFEGEEGKGSGRSIPGFNLHDAVMNCDTYVGKFGGHSMAIGINVKRENFEKFKKEFEEYTQNSHISDIIPIIQIDKQVDIKKINIQEVNELKLLEPYGEGNKMPVFLIKNLKILSIRSLSEGKHIKLKLGIDNYMIDAIGFNMGEVADKYLIGDKVDIVGSLEVNQFGGNENIQVNLKDLRKTI